MSHLESDIKSGRQEDKRANVLRQITEEAFAEARKLESKWIAEIGSLLQFGISLAFFTAGTGVD